MKNGRLFNLRWFGVIFASLVLGIAFSSSIIAGIVFFFMLLTGLVIASIKTKKVRLLVVVLLTYLTGFLYASGLIYVNNQQKSYPNEGDIVATITSMTQHNIEGVAGDVMIVDNITFNGKKIKGKSTLVIDDNKVTTLHIGDKILFRGTLEARKLQINDIGATRHYVDGVKYFIEGNSLADVRHGKLPFRDRIILNAEKVLFSRLDKDTAGFLSGIMFGDTSFLNGNLRVSAKRLGISHLFAVSGLHVGMIVAFILAILDKCKVKKRYGICILPILAFYAYICGYSVSVMRATIMVTILLISRAIFARYDMLSSISLAGTILLLVSPMYLFDISFIMSFLAVISIALFSERLTKLFTKKSEKWKTFKSILAVNLSVNIGLLPIMLYLFGGVSLISLPANLIILPIVTFLFPIFFLIFIVVMLLHIHVLVPFIAFPFMLLVKISALVARVHFLGVNFDVSCYFVIAYIIVMFLVSKYVFINKYVKLVPRILLYVVLSLSLIIPPMMPLFVGEHLEGESMRYGYYALLKDNNNKDVLVVMGDINGYLMEKAISEVNSNRLGTVDIIVAPCLTQSDVSIMEYYNGILGAEYIVAKNLVQIDDATVVNETPGIVVTKTEDVVVDTESLHMLFANPNTTAVPYGYYDIVIAHNKMMNIDNIHPKYYINFAKDSQGRSYSGFTFYIKNGNIIRHDIV